VYNHAPKDYICPFCRIVREIASAEIPDFIFQNDHISAFMSLQDAPKNLGHVLVVPNEHYENIFDLPVSIAAKIHEYSRAVAIAMKSAYHCDGISIRQHNEPAGGQDVWHYHVHIIPRYNGDDPLLSEKVTTPENRRVEFAELLKAHLGGWIVL
jgi:histidine triad (HIT) family protein